MTPPVGMNATTSWRSNGRSNPMGDESSSHMRNEEMEESAAV